MNETRRALLDALSDGPVAGPELADRLGVSRAAVWKQVEALREDGFGVESGDDGYRVTDVPEYGESAIAFGLDAPFEVEYHDSLDSSNDRGRELAVEGASDVVVVADEQTGSRGRLKREWTAPSGGVWMSLVLRPDRPPAHVPAFTLAAAVATTRAAREAGVDAHIKWPNDVLVGAGDDPDDDAEAARRGGRKLAGILTEMEGEADRVSWLVVGIGVNANVDAADLPPGATSIREEAGDVDRRAFVQRLLEEFHSLREDTEAVLPAWREYASTLGRRVRVETPGGTVEGEAVDVRFPGALVVRTDDGEEVVHAGDCEHLRSA
ncbi:biotin--[acetyl-CoA-carboxylase] ligase [Halopelagius fulvigenes]|uniref:Biotin--[acetyl-CoA-carboxylase] ligase n=1 Tax=Halopelagius fulvigenes TaxID=1198324 RepID=A0ABD5U0P2_9EURY